MKRWARPLQILRSRALRHAGPPTSSTDDGGQMRNPESPMIFPGDGSTPAFSFFSHSSPSWSDALFPEAHARLSKIDSLLEKQVRAALEVVHASALIGVRQEAERALAHALMLAELRRDLAELRTRGSRLTMPLYIVSALFLE